MASQSSAADAPKTGSVVTRALKTIPMTSPVVVVAAITVVLIIYFSLTLDHFATWLNIRLILDDASIPLLFAIGMTFVVLGQGFDLSGGAIFAGAGITTAALIHHGMNAVPAVLIGLVVGCGLGIVNGGLIGFLGLDFFVVTLGTLSIFTGVIFLYTNGQNISVYESKWLVKFSTEHILGLPSTVIMAGFVWIVAWFVLRYTVYGRTIYAVGNSREASRLAGIRVSYVVASLYVISAVLAAFAGIVQAGRLTTAQTTTGSELPLSAAAAVFLGGTALTGGIGGVGGTLVAVLLLTIIRNGLDLGGISAYWQQVITGSVLIGAIYLNRLRLKRLGE